MNSFSSAWCLRGFVLAACVLGVAPKAGALEPHKVFEKVSRSVVLVLNHGDKGLQATGSGVVVEHQRVITNCHVLRQAKVVEVKVGTVRYAAQLLWPDPERDLCLLTVPELLAPAVERGTLAQLRVGQKVYTVGAPQGLELSLSDGLISSLRGKPGEQLIQTSAPISQGSSGGGLFDESGRLIGITTLSVNKGQNLNFAIPADYLRELPERGRAVMARYRQQQLVGEAPAPAEPPVVASAPSRPPAVSQTPALPPAPASAPLQANERQLTGEELERHVAGLRKVTIALVSGENLTLEMTWGQGFLFSNQQGMSEQVSGVRAVNQNDVCLRPAVAGAGLTRMSGVQRLHAKECYVVLQTGPQSFVWRTRPPSNTQMFSYSLP